LVLVAQAIVALDKNDVARPCQSEPRRVEGQHRILAGRRIFYDDMRRLGLWLGPAEDHGAAVLQQQDGRQRPPQLHQIIKTESCRDRPQASGLGNTHQFFRSGSVCCNAVVAPQLRRAQVNFAMPGHNCQGAEQRPSGAGRMIAVLLPFDAGHQCCVSAAKRGRPGVSSGNVATSATSR
jgi:hypothetical protein